MTTRLALVILMFLSAQPAIAGDPECYDTRQVPPAPFKVPPPRDGSPVRLAKPGPELEAYERWLADARRRHDAQWITQRVRVACPAHQATPWPLARARWEPGAVVYVPHPDYQPDPRPWDRAPTDAAPVPEPWGMLMVGMVGLATVRWRERS